MTKMSLRKRSNELIKFGLKINNPMHRVDKKQKVKTRQQHLHEILKSYIYEIFKILYIDSKTLMLKIELQSSEKNKDNV